MAMDKIKYLNSELAIKYMEEDIVKIEEQIATLVAEQARVKPKKTVNIETFTSYVRYFLEHLEYLLLHQMNPVAKASYFGLIFDKAPAC
jgi:hypothetical protein